MKLHLKRDCTDDDIAFTVYDESGNEKYRVSSVKTKVTKKTNLLLCDKNGDAAAKIRRLPIVGTYAYVLRVKRAHIIFAMVPVKGGVLSYFYGNNWHINGSVAAKNFTVIDVDKTVICSHRRHTDYCTLEIFDRENELYCIAAAVCVNLLHTIEQPALAGAEC